MPSTAPYLAVVHLTIVFVCVFVCQGGILDFDQHRHEGEEFDAPYHGEHALIEFPALDEMTSSERAANRQRARKVATIIEKSFHMLADDILQMWAIARTERTHNEVDANAEEETEEEDGAEVNKGKYVKTTEDPSTKKTEVEDIEAVDGIGPEETEDAEAQKIDKSDAKAIDEKSVRIDVKTTKDPHTKTTEEANDKAVNETRPGTAGSDSKTTKGVNTEITKTPAANTIEGVNIEITKTPAVKTTEGVNIEITKTPAAKTTEGVNLEITKTPAAKTTEGVNIEITKTPAAKTTERAHIMVADGSDAKAVENTDANSVDKRGRETDTKSAEKSNGKKSKGVFTIITVGEESSSMVSERVQNSIVTQDAKTDDPKITLSMKLGLNHQGTYVKSKDMAVMTI